MKIKTILTLIAILYSSFLFSQEDTVLHFTVQEAQEYAIENNIEIINKELDIKKAKWQIWETTSIGLPQVSGTVEYQQFPDIPTQLMPNFLDPTSDEKMEMQFGNEFNLSWGITATQLLFSGEYFVGLQASRIYKELSTKDLEKSVIDLNATIKQSYYLVLITEQSTNTLEGSFANIVKIREETEALQKAGMIDKSQLDQIKFTELTLKNQIMSMERQVALTRRLLKFQLGIDLNDTIVLTENLEQIIATQDFNSYIISDFSVQSNIDYNMMQTQENLARLDMRRSQSSCLPTVSAFYSYSEKAMRDEFNFEKTDDNPWFPTSLFGINVSVPIFGSGQRYAQIQQKKISLYQVQNSKLNIEQALTVQYSEAKNKYINAYETNLNDKENIRLAESIYNDTQIKYKNGTASSMELTQAQNQYLNAQAQYFNSLMNLLKEKSNLDKLTNQ